MSAPSRAPLSSLPARVASWFIPPDVGARGSEALIRSQATLAIAALGLVIGAVTAAADLVGGARTVGLVILPLLAPAAAVPFVLRRTGSPERAGNLLVATLFAMIFVPGVLTLGRASGVVFVFLVPVLAVLLCSRRAALGWSILAAGSTLVLGGLAASSWAAPLEPPAASPFRLHRIGLVAVVMSAACVFAYDVFRTHALRELERANAALHESREQFRKLVATSPDAVSVTQDGRLVYVNSRAIELLGGASEADVLGLRGEEVIDGSKETVTRLRSEVAAGRRLTDVRVVIVRLDGHRVPVEVSASPTLFHGRPAVLSVMRDRSEEERTLARLRLLGTVVEQSTEGVLVVDAGGTVRYVNEAYASNRGLPVDQLIGRPVRELPRDDAARGFLRGLPRRLAASGGATGGRFTFDGPSGRRSWDIRMFPVQTDHPASPVQVTLLRDVSREVELEERSQQSQKMEAVGQLAGGVAHDFNNNLTVILGRAEELRASLPPDSSAAQEVASIVDAAERSAALTQQLLAFARRQPVDVRVVDPNAIVRGMRDMLRRLLPESIELVVELSPQAPPVLADRGQLGQVVLNLVLNARDAIDGAGRIRVATGVGPLPEKLWDGDAREAPVYATLRVRDDGHGMDEATRARAFEPFFTTKPAGRGTGLGLSSVHGIVLQSGGAIAIDSAPDAGTDVVVYLPAADAPVQADAEPRRRSAPKERATGTVLVVEDDDPVRRVTRRALESAGYRVLEAADAEQALAHAERAAIDLVVSDI
ncbi:MAG TPA: PAS domain-containing protein, partial [Myxococcota bacterium]|nr:PAS domain-containing protein [Myxococcota bacterium]